VPVVVKEKGRRLHKAKEKAIAMSLGQLVGNHVERLYIWASPRDGFTPIR